ncbi:MAG: formylglycine-generating enzyme family protein, partial [bacterium]
MRCYFILVGLIIFSGILHAQSIENIRFHQAEDDRVIVNYDIVGGKDQRFEVSLLVSDEGGQTFYIQPRSVTGDVGKDVEGGRGKQIIWEVLSDIRRLQGDAFIFKVIAKPDRPRLDQTLGLEWIFVKGGTFEMGDWWGDGGDDEKPVHTVTVLDFWMSKYEVTVAQFRAFCQATGHKMPKQPDWNQDHHPVVNVTWHNAIAFCRWLDGRLPREAEWEYAARVGGKEIKYPNGKNLTHDDANFTGTGGRD